MEFTFNVFKSCVIIRKRFLKKQYSKALFYKIYLNSFPHRFVKNLLKCCHFISIKTKLKSLNKVIFFLTKMRNLCKLSYVISVLTSIIFVPLTIQIQAINVFGAKTITLPTLTGSLETIATSSTRQQLTLSAHDGFNGSSPSVERNQLPEIIHQKAQHGKQPMKNQAETPINNVPVVNKSAVKVNGK